jgi:hypothetical protein
MHKPRYVVVNIEGEWRIRQAGRHFKEAYPSKAQALCAAIEFAEQDGDEGLTAEVLVRHEDDHFITEWVYGEDPHANNAALPNDGRKP